MDLGSIELNEIKALSVNVCKIVQGTQDECDFLSRSDAFHQLLSRLLDAARVSRVSDDLERNSEALDFLVNEECVQEVFKLLTLFHIYLLTANCPLSDSDKLYFTSVCLILILEYADVKHPWSKPTLSCAAELLLAKLLQMHNVLNTCELLMVSSPGHKNVFQSMIEVLKPRLRKNHWKQNPASVVCFTAILTELKSPEVGNYLSDILPLLLNLIDDFEAKNKIVGLKCVQHLLSNTTKSELFWYGRADVLYAAVQPSLYSNDPEVMHHALPCMLQLSLVIDFNATPKEVSVQYTKLDDVYGVVLTNMNLESSWSLRREYSQVFSAFIEALGVQVLKHSEKTLNVIEHYIDIPDSQDEATRVNTLRALVKLIEAAWPRIDRNLCRIVQMLLKLIVDTTDANMEAGAKAEVNGDACDLLTLVKEAVALLSLLNHDKTTEILRSVLQIDLLHASAKEIVKDILETIDNSFH